MLYDKALIMCRSKVQKTSALSTAEAGYYYASTAAAEVKYLRNLLERMGCAQQAPTSVCEDNYALYLLLCLISAKSTRSCA